MAGHSHWAQIKRKKGANDAKRGKLFSKIAKKIMAAARAGGGDPAANLTLRYAIDEGRKVNMPKDSIDNAIKKGTGELGGGNELEELIYGGYGPGGVAVLCEVVTDNRNRTTPELKKLFEKRGGKFDDSGSTQYKFEQLGVVYAKGDAIDEDDLLELLIEVGVEQEPLKVDDEEGGVWEIRSPVEAFSQLRKALDEKGVPVEDASVSRLPMMPIPLGEKDAEKVQNLLEDLDDHDDVSNVFTDAEFPR